ncbi:MAG: zinc ribbon domain-containing protein [Promethearchaeota archaeon]|nr:MAG: zinc ribbon domain-containing protein [Candidatus Lokiarchaeota archaeon]
MIKSTLHYENRFKIDIIKAFNLTIQWLASQHKAKIKKSTPHSFIEAKQGTMMANTGHDPNWKKRIRISFYQFEQNYTTVRIEATPIARNIFRLEKLKQSWYNGLFNHLFSVLRTAQEIETKEQKLLNETNVQKTPIYCPNCGKKVDGSAIICPRCGVDII